MSVGQHDSIMESPRLSQWLRYLATAVAAATLAWPAQAANSQIDACDRLQMVVWGIIAPGSTFGLIKNLEAVPGVDHVSFDLRHALATIEIRHGVAVTDSQLRAAVKSASYTPREINRPSTCPNPGSDE